MPNIPQPFYPCDGPPIIANRPRGLNGATQNIRQPPDRECEEGVVFLLFGFPGSSEKLFARFYRVDVDPVEEISTILDANAQFYGMLQKIGDIHYATWEDLTKNSINLYRSTDGCVTWNLSFEAINSFYAPELALSSDKTHWLSAAVEDIPQLYKSVDKGEHWTLVHTFEDTINAEAEVSIACHPSNSNVILAVGHDGEHCTVGISVNGGASFSITQLTGDDQDFLDFYGCAKFTPSGVGVVAFHDYSSAGIGVTPTAYPRVAFNSNLASGGNWIVKDLPLVPEIDQSTDYVCDPGFGPLQIISENEWLICGNSCWDSNQFTIWRTTDGGNKWEIAVSGITGEDSNEGMRYFYADKKLYAANHFGLSAGSNAELYVNKQPYDGEWEELIHLNPDDTSSVFFEPAWMSALAKL